MTKKRKLALAVSYRKPSRNRLLRDRKSIRFNEAARLPPVFRAFVMTEIRPHLKIPGQRQQPEVKNEILVHLINNLVLAGMRNMTVADSRDHTKPGVYLRRNIWDAVMEAGLAECCKGSEESKKVTRYFATPELLKLFEGWEVINLVSKLERNTQRDTPTKQALVVLQKKHKDTKTGKRKTEVLSLRNHPLITRYPGLRTQLRLTENEVERINSANLDHAWKTYEYDEDTGESRVIPLDPRVRQIHTGKLFRGCRLYSCGPLSAQNITKQQRREALIDGERTAYLDYSAYATRMHYHMKGIDPDSDRDIYNPELILPMFYTSRPSAVERSIVRDLVKTATNIMWNSKSRYKAKLAVEKRLTEQDHRIFLRDVLERVEKMNPWELLGRIMEAHAPLEDHFFQPDMADQIGWLDGLVMLRILGRFADAKKPALGLHDAILCKRSDARFAEKVMKQVYRGILGFDPVVKRAY